MPQKHLKPRKKVGTIDHPEVLSAAHELIAWLEAGAEGRIPERPLEGHARVLCGDLYRSTAKSLGVGKRP